MGTSHRHWWAELPPAAGAAVMATGIISVALHLTGWEGLSLAGLGIAGALWLLLAGDVASRLVGDRARFEAEADTPPALTAVAATTVLGTRLSMLGWQTVAAVLLVLAAVAWPGLLTAVMRHWTRRTPGAGFLVCVATEGLAVLAAVLAAAEHQTWLAWVALVFFLLGLPLYLDALMHFDTRQVRTGSGDQWVAAGALAISALAGSKLVASTAWHGSAHTALRTATLVLLALALAGYAIMLACEVRWPRTRYDVRRWATVFPLGMTATACLSTADAAHLSWLLPWLRTLGQVLMWVSVAAWLLTAAALAATCLRSPAAPGGRR